MLCPCPPSSLPAITEALFMKLDVETQQSTGWPLHVTYGSLKHSWLSSTLFSWEREVLGFKLSREIPKSGRGVLEGHWRRNTIGNISTNYNYKQNEARQGQQNDSSDTDLCGRREVEFLWSWRKRRERQYTVHCWTEMGRKIHLGYLRKT